MARRGDAMLAAGARWQAAALAAGVPLAWVIYDRRCAHTAYERAHARASLCGAAPAGPRASPGVLLASTGGAVRRDVGVVRRLLTAAGVDYAEATGGEAVRAGVGMRVVALDAGVLEIVPGAHRVPCDAPPGFVAWTCSLFRVCKRTCALLECVDPLLDAHIPETRAVSPPP